MTEGKAPGELSQAQLQTAEAELKEGATEMPAAPLDRFAAQLAIWQQHETKRTIAQEQYLLTVELKGPDREAWVRQYAEAKRALLAVERRMAATLQEMGMEAEGALQQRFLVPGYGVVGCSFGLRERLAKALEARMLPVTGGEDAL